MFDFHGALDLKQDPIYKQQNGYRTLGEPANLFIL